jgi:hypothetical protein
VSSGTENFTIAQLQQFLHQAIEDQYGSTGGTDVSECNAWKAKGDERLTKAMLNGVVPKQEFEPLIEAALRKLKVSEDRHAEIRTDVLEALPKEGALKEDIDAAVLKALQDRGIETTAKAVEQALNEPRGLVIADTNWGDGQHVVQFSMVVNPLTDEIEMWQMNEDGTSPSKVDQKDWIKESEWRVFDDTGAIGGAMGDEAWEKRRGELRAGLKECVSNRQGNIGMMQAVLEIADQKFADGDRDAGVKALDKLEAMVKRGKKLAENVTAVKTQLESFKKEVQKTVIDETGAAVAFLDKLIKEVEALRDDNAVTDFVTRRADELELLKQGQEPLGVAVDVPTLLNQA